MNAATELTVPTVVICVCILRVMILQHIVESPEAGLYGSIVPAPRVGAACVRAPAHFDKGYIEKPVFCGAGSTTSLAGCGPGPFVH